MSARRQLWAGTPCPGGEPLYRGEVNDGGGRIQVWVSDRDSPYRITVAHSLQVIAHESGFDGEEFIVNGGNTVGGLGQGAMSVAQVEALIVELQLAVRASRHRDGEPWAEREIAPGVIRAPEVRE